MNVVYHGARLVQGTWSHGLYPRRPDGVVIHYTADRDVDRVYRALSANGYGYHLVIRRDGAIDQLCRFNEIAWHAGAARWNGVMIGLRYIGVALVSWGLLSRDGSGRYRTWSGQPLVDYDRPDDDVVYRPGNLGPTLYYWDAATEAQMAVLLELLRWFVAQGILAGNICGHDECAVPSGRKCDPGGILPMTMDELRRVLSRSE